MNELLELSSPLDHVLNCCEKGIMPTALDILDAKNQLRKTRDQIESLMSCYQNTRTIGREDRARWLNAEQDRAKLSEENKLLQESLNKAIAWAKIDRGDLYDPFNTHVFNNHIDNKQIMLPLYSNKEEMKKVVDGLKERLTS
jgi:hypothetical protein